MTEHSSEIQMLSLKDVVFLVRLKKSTIYNWMNKNSPRYNPDFPLPRKIGSSNRWLKSEIDDFCTKKDNSNNALKGGCPVDSEVSNIQPAQKKKATKAIGKGALPSSKPEMTPGNLLECPAPVKRNAEPLQSQITQLDGEKITGVVLGEQQTVSTQPLAATDLIVPTENPNTPVDETSKTPDGAPVTSSSQNTPRESGKKISTMTARDAHGRLRTIQVETRIKLRGTQVKLEKSTL